MKVKTITRTVRQLIDYEHLDFAHKVHLIRQYNMAKKNNNTLQTISEVITEDIIPDIIETPVIVTDTLTDEISAFVKSMIGKQRATPEETRLMFSLYNRLTGSQESNYNCDVCVIRVFKVLREHIKN